MPKSYSCSLREWGETESNGSNRMTKEVLGKNTTFPKPVSNWVSWYLNQDLRDEMPATKNHRTYGSTHITRITVAG